MATNTNSWAESVPELLSLKKTCEILKCHPNTLRQWDKNGLLKAVRFGKRKDRRYRREDILKILKSHLHETPAVNNQYGLDFFEREAETAIERISRLQLITAALSRAVSMKDIADIILTQGLSACGSCCGLIAFINEEAGTLEISQYAGFAKREMNKIKKLPLIHTLPITDAARVGDPIFIETLEESKVRYPHSLPFNERVPHESCAVIPMVTNHKVLGVLGFYFEATQQFRRNDISFLLALTRQCAQALDRARLFESEQTARSRAELLEAQFRNVLETMHDGFVSLDTEWNVTYINSQAEKLLQTTYQDIAGKPIRKAYPPHEYREYYEKAEETMKTGTTHVYEAYVPIIKKWFDIRIYPTQDGIATLFQDISERKMLKQKLQDREKELKKLRRRR